MATHTWGRTFGVLAVFVILMGAGCVGLVFLFGGGIFAIFAMTTPVVEASEEFLTLVSQDKTKEAYAATAAGFRARQDEAAFTAAVKKIELNDFASVFWNNRRINNDTGSTAGTVTTRKQTSRPIEIQLVREEGRWKVASVRYGGVDLAEVKLPPPPVPEVAALQAMTLRTLLDFNEAVLSADFTKFYETTSTAWKKETTPAQLRKAFAVFVDNKIGIGGVKDVEPEFRPNAFINANGLLEISGHYPTRPQRVNFTLRYHHQPEGWKISYMDISVNN